MYGPPVALRCVALAPSQFAEIVLYAFSRGAYGFESRLRNASPD
jgi:hypothetical protein